MSNQIDSLTDEQALQALHFFFEYSTPEIWADDRKPGPERIQQVGEALIKNAPEELKSSVTALTESGAGPEATRARVARIVLARLAQTPQFQPTVDHAIETVLRPHKFGIDPITGGFIVAFLLATSKIERTPKGWKLSLGGNMAQVLHELPGIIKGLPQNVWSHVAGKQ